MYRSLHGLTRTLIANMVVGVTDGWTKELEIIGVGYRAADRRTRACSTSPSASRTPCKFTAPEGITFEVPAPDARDHQGCRQGGRRPGGRVHPQDP